MVSRHVRVPRLPVGADAGSSAGASEAILDARNVAGSIDEFDDEVRQSGGAGGHELQVVAASHSGFTAVHWLLRF